ncbi:MAG: hypothetical protein D6718_06630 [Acidobacteria bacterium]|nr:MAG: hypothetical protein D6718_06630 [Acidobacteriota bacterium]
MKRAERGVAMGVWTARHVWNALPVERRERVALALWEDERLGRAERLAALQPWLNAHGMRIAFLEQMPRVRRAALLARGGLPEETAQQALMSYHLVHQRPLLSRFLDLVGIPHKDGLIEDPDGVEAPSAEAVGKAVEAIRKEFPEEDVELYLRTLTAADSEMWRAVADAIDGPQ